MSSIPSGAVPITFAADRSQIDNFLAELRRGYTVPLNFAPGGAQSAVSPRGYTAPYATAPNAVANYASAVSPAALGFTGGSNGTGTNGAASLQPAATALTQAANALSQAATALQGGGAGSATQAVAGTGGGGSGTGIFGLRRGMFSRYTTIGLASRALYEVGSAYQQKENADALALTPMDQLKAQHEFAQSIANSLPIKLLSTVESLYPERAQVLNPAIRREMISYRNAIESGQDSDAAFDRYRSANDSRRQVYGLELETNRLRLRSDPERRQQEIYDSFQAEVKKAQDRQQELKTQAAGTSNPFERQRLILQGISEAKSSGNYLAAMGDRNVEEMRKIREEQRNAFREDLGGIRARNESAGLLTGSDGTPEERQRRAELNTIVRRTELQQLGALTDGLLLPEQRRLKSQAINEGGVLQLEAEKQNFFNNLQAGTFSPNRTALAPETAESPKDASESFDKAIATLRKQMQDDTDKIVKALGGLVVGS